MLKKLLKTPKYLNLKDVGILEMVFAVTPILSSYDIGNIPMSVFMWIILLVTLFLLKGRIRMKVFKPLVLFIVYWLFRSVYLMFADNLNINGLINQFICFIAVFSLYPCLDLKKLQGSINWVAIIAIVGLLYQWTLVSMGIPVHPLEIPGLTLPEVRLQGLSLRPSSFFMEPAAYASFMICPLALAFKERKYAWAVIIIISMFLTGSTTGILLSFIILGMFLFAGKIKGSTSLVVIIIGIGLLYSLTHFQIFDTGFEKLENTDTEENVRLTQGRYIVSTMEANELIFGASYSTAYNYCKSGRAPNVIYYGQSVYVSTFWLMILLYGVVGLILYINTYWQIVKKSRTTLPLVTCLCAVMFSSGYALGGTYFFTLILLLVIARNETESIVKNNYINNKVYGN